MTVLTKEDLIAAAEAWQAQDPDQATIAELDALIAGTKAGDATAEAELHDRFDTRLAFGTAGLRGEMGAGPNRMNRVLVSQAAAGFAAYLVDNFADPSIVIGYDGRYNSYEFAQDTAEIMAAAGVRALLQPRMLPTPVTAFVLRHLNLSAAVMVTASHNPGKDNGYKVYLGGADAGSQIISPTDEEIAAYIERVAKTLTVPQLARSDNYTPVPESAIQAYIDQTVAATPNSPRDIFFVYTAMHGVGWETAREVFKRAGFHEPAIVAEQIEPDPAFPTVPFPNPEEPGAMDLSFTKATEVGADLIIANDPDADRLAVGIPDPTAPSGWRRLTGNEVGSLLGEYIAQVTVTTVPNDKIGGSTLACSLVSSPLLREIAQSYGLRHEETLTGFKYVNRVPGLVFGYEEALGYLVDPDLVRDKDGVSAAAAFLGYAARLKAAGKTIADALADLTDKYGAYGSDQVSVRVSDLSKIAKVMAGLRADAPTEFGGSAVIRADDLANGFEGLPPGDVLRYFLADGSRIIFRPSGTEPKLKVYLDVVVKSDGDASARGALAKARLAELSSVVTEIVERLEA